MSGLAINLWSPQHGLSVGVALLTAFLLGIVHGVTPDEHTWPITFSYAVGSFSARKGMRSALAFSLAFTLQRALLSELAYLGLLEAQNSPSWNAAIYLVVGAAMVLAAFYVLRLRCSLHLHLWPPSVGGCHSPQHADTAEWAGRTPTPAMATLHGFIAGWGMGAFALIMMTVLAPAMPSAALGWAPGAAFGLGTTAVLAGAGAVIGSLIRRQRLPRRLAERVAQEGAGWTLLAGGLLFTVAGAAGLAIPPVMTAGIGTGIHVHNLDQVNIGTLLVILVVAVAVITITRTIRRLRHLPDSAAQPGQLPEHQPVTAGTAPDDRRTSPAGNQATVPPRCRGPAATGSTPGPTIREASSGSSDLGRPPAAPQVTCGCQGIAPLQLPGRSRSSPQTVLPYSSHVPSGTSDTAGSMCNGCGRARRRRQSRPRRHTAFRTPPGGCAGSRLSQHPAGRQHLPASQRVAVRPAR